MVADDPIFDDPKGPAAHPHRSPAMAETPMRYRYIGDRMTDPALVNAECDPVLREDGKCIISQRMSTQLVQFADGGVRVVLRRRLRVQK